MAIWILLLGENFANGLMGMCASLNPLYFFTSRTTSKKSKKSTIDCSCISGIQTLPMSSGVWRGRPIPSQSSDGFLTWTRPVRLFVVMVIGSRMASSPSESSITSDKWTYERQTERERERHQPFSSRILGRKDHRMWRNCYFPPAFSRREWSQHPQRSREER